MKTLLFIIDMQNDFCSPAGTLYIPGAEKDVERVSRLINVRMKDIDGIVLTQDNHQVIDIAHPAFWRDTAANHPVAFTVITAADVRNGKWMPVSDKEEIIDYLQQLEENREYIHTIWPEHCIWGSEGAAIVPELMREVIPWARQGKFFELISKGVHPFTEHFGAFRANVPHPEFPETTFNCGLVEEMDTYDCIWLAGEAKSHCVANTLKQLLDFPHIIRKLIVLQDAMSPVAGCESLADPVFEQVAKARARFTMVDYLISNSQTEYYDY